MPRPRSISELQALEDAAGRARTRRHVTQFHQAALAVELLWVSAWYLLGYPLASVASLLGAAALAANLGFLRRGPLMRFVDAGALATIMDVFVVSITAPANAPSPLMFLVFAPIYAWILSTAQRARRWAAVSVVVAVMATVINDVTPLNAGVAALSHREVLAITGTQALSLIALALLAMHMLQRNHAAIVAVVTTQQDRLRAQNRTLADTQLVKDRFFAAVSHELRTPMSAISGIAELLRPVDLDRHEREELTDALGSASRHLLRVIDDLLDLTRLKERKVELAPEAFDLRQLVTEAFEMGRRRGTEVDFRCAVDAALPRYVQGDRKRLAQVLVNLVGNAAKFTRTGSVTLRVTGAPVVRAGKPAALAARWTLAFTVEDTGIGISPDRQRALFQDFVQADASIGPRFGGTGLGLAISRRLVELMAGTLTCASTPGRGSRFEVRIALPVADAPTPIVAPRRTAAPGKRILVVDDHDLNRSVVRRQLERQFPGVTVDEVADGEAAVAAVANAPASYDLVLMDMQMPVMSGDEATRHIRHLADAGRARVPIVAMTGASAGGDLEACLAAGVDHALPKPVPVAHLIAVLQPLLRIPPPPCTDG